MNSLLCLLAVAAILPSEPRPSETYAAAEYSAWTDKLTGAPALVVWRQFLPDVRP